MKLLGLAIALVVFSVVASVRADHLEIRRNALLKRAPERDGGVVERLSPSTLVALVGTQQQNGYYKVETREGKRGFVYRTLVRRHRGPLPDVGSDPDEPTPGEEPDLEEGEDSEGGEGSEDSEGGEDGHLNVDALEPLEGDEMRAHLINVGQGAATLFEFTCAAALIDTGGESSGAFDSDRELEAYLEAFFTRRADLNRTLSLLVITHAHIDHTRGAALVTSEYSVENVVTNGLLTKPEGNFHSGGRKQQALEEFAQESAKLFKVTASSIPKGGKTNKTIDPIQCQDQDPKISVLWGRVATKPDDWTKEAFEDANNHSVVVRVELGEASFLVSGDLEADAVPAVIKKHGNSGALDTDVWYVSHHGSENGTDGAILDAITPEIALLGTGDPARKSGLFTAFAHGHPRKTVITQLLDRLTRKRSEHKVPIASGQRKFRKTLLDEAIYATGWDGSVVVTADSEGRFEVLTER